MLLTGAGGCGKSYFACNKKSWVDKLFVCDAYRTTEDKKEEYNIKTAVVALLLRGRHANKLHIHPSVIICDEATKYHGQILTLMKQFPYSKFVILADVNHIGEPYQLADWNTEEKFPMNLFDTKKNFTDDRRCKDPKLAELKKELRKEDFNMKEIINKCQKITVDEIKKVYKKTDYVLVARRSCSKKVERCTEDHINEEELKSMESTKQKNKYIKQCKIDQKECKDPNHLEKVSCGEHWCRHPAKKYTKQIQYYSKLLWDSGEKYMMIKRNKKYENGTILFEKPDVHKSLYEPRHAFTVHSIQGMTIKRPHKIFIDVSKFWLKEMLYVAISRAEYLDQIYIIL